jgi:hypothetical protein
LLQTIASAIVYILPETGDESMTRLGTTQKPAVVRVQTQAKAEEILSICEDCDWKVLVGVEPDETEEISDLE